MFATCVNRKETFSAQMVCVGWKPLENKLKKSSLKAVCERFELAFAVFSVQGFKMSKVPEGTN